MRPQTFLAGRTAAVHLGLSVGPGALLEVGVLAPNRAPRARGVRGVKVAPHLANVIMHDEARTTDAASTWAMLGAELTIRELVALGDEIVRVPRDRRGSLVPRQKMGTIDDLANIVAAGRRRGIGRLHEALPLVRVGSASPLETDFRLDAAAGGLPTPELDVEIHDRNGTLLGITEFVFPQFRTAVEIEGDHHRTDRTQWNRDIDKYAAYAAEGWEVVRLTSAHVRGNRSAVGTGPPSGITTRGISTAIPRVPSPERASLAHAACSGVTTRGIAAATPRVAPHEATNRRRCSGPLARLSTR